MIISMERGIVMIFSFLLVSAVEDLEFMSNTGAMLIDNTMEEESGKKVEILL